MNLPRHTWHRLTFLYLELFRGVPVKKIILYDLLSLPLAAHEEDGAVVDNAGVAEVLAPSLAQGGHLSPPGLHLWFQRFIFHCQITRHTLVSMMSLLCFLERKSSHDQICSGIFICYLAITQNTKLQNREIGDNLKSQPHLPSVRLKNPLKCFTFIIREIQGAFFTGTPPKSSKYKKLI